MESRKATARLFVKSCCRVCGKTVDQRNRKALFTIVGLRDRIADRLSHLSELTVKKDDLSEFACRKCIDNLDKLTRMQIQSEQLKTELVNALMETSLRHRSALSWGLKEPSGGDSVVVTARPPLSTTSTGSPSRIPLPKQVLPTTPQSAEKPTPKRARSYRSPELQTANAMRPSFPHPIARTLFEDDGNRSQVIRVAAMLIHSFYQPPEIMPYLSLSQQLAEPLPSSSNSTTRYQQNHSKPTQSVPVKVKEGQI